MSELRLSPAQLEAVIAHARSRAPEEACGILAGDDTGAVKRVYAMQNADRSETTYAMDSREQFEVFDEIRSEGLELLAIFHSHPSSEAYPSARDLELAFYPEAYYMIVSLMDEEPACRTFRILDGEVRETGFVLDEEGRQSA